MAFRINFAAAAAATQPASRVFIALGVAFIARSNQPSKIECINFNLAITVRLGAIVHQLLRNIDY